MPVTLRKPTHVLAYLGTQLGGDHDLEVRGEIVKRAHDVTHVRVTTVKGGATGRLYPHLNGQVVELPTLACLWF